MARAHQLPLSFLRDPTDAPPRWTWRDKTLALALQEHEDGLHRCGHPRSVAFSPDAEGFYELGAVVCQACAALERHQAQHSGSGSDPVHGQQVLSWNAAGPGERIRPWNGRLTPIT